VEVEGVKITRRRLLMALSIGAGGFVAAVASVPLLGFFFSPMLRRFPPVWREVGPLEQFPVGATVQINVVTSGGLPWDGPAKRVGAWLRRNNESNFTVRWIVSAELFMCPCHGGVYYKDGDVAAGPPPQPLQQFPVRVQDGQVQVQWKPLQVNYAMGGPPCKGCPGAITAPNRTSDSREDV
jgi:menaquinol-cytochrome c reductase iron-sulfur subunit